MCQMRSWYSFGAYSSILLGCSSTWPSASTNFRSICASVTAISSSLLCVHGTAHGSHGVAWVVPRRFRGGATMATQDEYRAKAREALEKLQQQIDELKVQANLAGAEARDRLDKAIDALRKRQAETRTKLDQAADATGDAWKNAAKQ